MKYAFASALAALMIAGGAIAQTTAPTPAAPAPAAATPVPASTCPAYPAAPTVPTAESIRNQAQLDAANSTINTYINAWNTVHTCRVAEVTQMKAISDARIAEAKAAQDTVNGVRTNWTEVGAAVVAGNAKKKDSRGGRQ